ncbi:MAG TPA: hypothetical protein VMJ35_11370 [Dongiaceae bacterium]|nr:hypothetical protein [Dongiaceae bacterium]
MDANNREPAHVGMPTLPSVPAARITENILAHVADAKYAAASGLERTALSLRSGADQVSDIGHAAAEQVSDIGHSAAERIQATADYVRDAELEGIATDVRNLVRRYPTQLLVGAALLGFFVARTLTRSR